MSVNNDLEGCVGSQSAERACVKRPTQDPRSGRGRPLKQRCDFCNSRLWGSGYSGARGSYCTVRCYLRAMWGGK